MRRRADAAVVAAVVVMSVLYLAGVIESWAWGSFMLAVAGYFTGRLVDDEIRYGRAGAVFPDSPFPPAQSSTDGPESLEGRSVHPPGSEGGSGASG